MVGKNIHLSLKDIILQSQGLDPMNRGLISGIPSHFVSTQMGHGDEYEELMAAAFLAYLLPGTISQIRSVPLLVSGRLSFSRAGQLYGPALLGLPTFGGIAAKFLYDKLTQSSGQDGKPGVSTPSVPPRTPDGTKPSKPIRSGSTSKPFWSSGKPKCKKGFRYDFKRKLCVKIK